VDIKQRLQSFRNNEPNDVVVTGKVLDELCRDALAEIERLEANAANYDIPRKTENIVRIAAALIIAGHDRDLVMRRALESYEVLVCELKDASNR
jgi:hypothetical protein